MRYSFDFIFLINIFIFIGKKNVIVSDSMICIKTSYEIGIIVFELYMYKFLLKY